MDSVISINDVLAQDLLARQDKEVREKDLISISTLKSKKWDLSSPTVFSDKKVKLITDPSQVIEAFLKVYPIFRDVNMENVLIAGGSVTSAILGIKTYSDVDLFVYGITIKDVAARIKQLVKDLNIKGSGTILKTTFATTITYQYNQNNNGIIQIIHRLYNSPSEILHGFDLGSCATGILLNETNVVTTSLGKISLEYMINIWDETKRSTTYDHRLSKYSNRGFSIVLPDLDIKKIRQYCSTVSLLGVELTSCSNKGNEISCRYKPTNNAGQISDYMPSCASGRKQGSFVGTNINRILKGKDLIYFQRWSNKNELLKYLFDSKIEITDEDIEKYSCRTFYNDGIIYATKIKALLGEKEALYWITQLYLTEGSVEVCSEIKLALMTKTKEIITRGTYAYKSRWVTVNPASQITGSFKPRSVTKAMFYGDYLKV